MNKSDLTFILKNKKTLSFIIGVVMWFVVGAFVGYGFCLKTVVVIAVWKLYSTYIDDVASKVIEYFDKDDDQDDNHFTFA